MSTKINKTLTASILLLLVISAFFMVNAEMPAWSYLVSGISILVFSLPSIFAALRWLGFKHGLGLFVLLGFFAVTIESIAIYTGFPYGYFSYSGELGYKLFGIVPWTVFFAWTPLLLAAYVSCRIVISSVFWRVAASALLLTVFDLVLDPGAVRAGFWTFDESGWFYGVPVSNFLGWIFSGTLGAILIELFVGSIKPLLPVPVQLMQSGFLLIFYWTAVAVFAGLYIPALIGSALVVTLAAIYFFYHYAFDDMVVLVDEENKPVGTAPKLSVHTKDTPLHRAFSVFIFNGKGALLLQRRADHKKTWGGVWSNSCCGHVMLHESVERAAKRRLNCELGLKGVELRNVLPGYRYRAEKDGIVENEFCPVLVGVADVDPKINPLEVAEYEWIEWDEFLAQASKPDTEFSPWAVEEAQLLSENEEFREMLKSHRR